MAQIALQNCGLFASSAELESGLTEIIDPQQVL